MPKLADRWVKAEAADGTAFSEKVSLNVTVDGVFTSGVPAALEESLLAFLEQSNSGFGRDRSIDGVGVKYSKGHCRLTSKSLDAVIKLLEKCAEDYLRCAVQTERVIVYGALLGVQFWLNKDGSIAPNGGSDDAKRDGKWWDPAMDKHHMVGYEHANFYQVGLAAAVFDKQTFKRSSGDVVKWERVRESGDQYIEALNGFVRLAVDPERGDMRTMPYTPQASEFFYAVLLGLCRLGKNIDDFLGDEKRLRKAIAQGAPKLLTQ